MKKYDVVIIGGGVMGAASAYYLSQHKKSILLIDELSLNNTINASGDYSKAFRASYGKDVYYASLAIESMRLLKELEVKTKKQLLFSCGVLTLDSTKIKLRDNYQTLKKLGRRVAVMDKNKLQQTYPQIQAQSGILEYDGGILDAFAVVTSYVHLAKQNGVTILENNKVVSHRNDEVVFEDGKRVVYAKAIITAGIGTNSLLENKLPITITKQNVIYVQPNKIKHFTKNVLPAFTFPNTGYYGVPMYGINAVKIASHIPGKVIKSIPKGEMIDRKYILDCRKFLRKYIPDLADAKVIASKVCYYDMTPDGDFIVDFLDSKTIVATGFSGHGFKFAPLIGKAISELTIFGKTRYDISRFQLKRFS
ncbi:MAG: FAD-dependent oxidoreductase [Candidatus Levybacteria bacterium]|nr:FAD-dependent oxidoreductase [Candidatus Levybacteria bacterium]